MSDISRGLAMAIRRGDGRWPTCRPGRGLAEGSGGVTVVTFVPEGSSFWNWHCAAAFTIRISRVDGNGMIGKG